MRNFSYLAVNEAGVISRGELRAADELQLEELLARRGLTLVRHLLLRSWVQREREIGPIARADMVEFARYVSVTCRAGLSIVESIDDYAARCTKPNLRAALQRVSTDVRNGMPMAEAFGRHKRAFDPIFVSMVRAGEASGALDDAMQRAGDQMEFQLSVRNQLRSSLTPPAILAVALIGLVVLLLTFLLPRLMEVMTGTGVELPLPTRMLLVVSDALIAYWPLLLGGLVAAFVGLKIGISRPAMALPISRAVLHIPGIGPLLRMCAEARFASTMRSLLAAGVDAVRALRMGAETTGSPWLRARFEAAALRVQAGESLASSLGAVEGLHPLLFRMLQLGEKAGNLEQTLDTAVAFYAAEIPRAIKRAMQLLEPAIVVGAGLTIAFIVLATLMPLFSLYDSMS